jgi:putative transposase
LDEVFVKLKDVSPCLWRAVDQDGSELGILVQKRRNKKAAVKFFKKLLKGQQATQLKIVTDKLPSYSAAKRKIIPRVEHLVNGLALVASRIWHEPLKICSYYLNSMS